MLLWILQGETDNNYEGERKECAPGCVKSPPWGAQKERPKHKEDEG